MMERVVILLITSFFTLPYIVRGYKEFELNFPQSTNKVIVTDLYYALEYSVLRDGREIQSVSLGTGLGGAVRSRKTPSGFILSGRGDEIEFSVEVDEVNYSQFSVKRKNIRRPTTDCVDLQGKAGVNWYGANQQFYQYYPVQKMVQRNAPYLPKEYNNTGIAERYWLNSNGVYLKIDNDAPLFIDQNNEHPDHLCIKVRRASPYDISQPTFDFVYHIGVGVNVRDAHMKAVQRFLGKPSGYPSEKLVNNPIWSTWAKYKRDVDEATVKDFAQQIIDHGYTGQMEIDDDWEECYGAFTFNKAKFPDIKGLTDWLHEKGFTVSLWVHPFIDKECESYYNDAKANGRLVSDKNGNSDLTWWNSLLNQGAYVDFTKPDVAKWWSDRLTNLRKSSGIDSYKFDAGETSWIPKNSVLNATSKEYPSKITVEYAKTVSRFGDLIELRTGFGTQTLPSFIRMIDKDTEWTHRNGLPTLITTLLQLNLNGYPLVLPDMIGGNAYNPCFVPKGAPKPETCVDENAGRPSLELYIRWLQANVFMPALQFSLVPWEYESQSAVELSKKFVDLHAKYAPYIMERFKLATTTGEPVNVPLWWIAPNDKIAQEIDDEFLLGDKILSAPIVEEGATQRDIYLPAGVWEDGNTGEVYILNEGKYLRNYPAPIEVLPYFIRKSE